MNDLTPKQRLLKLQQNWQYSLRRLFEEDSQRAEKHWLEACGLSLDFSKNHINGDVLRSLETFAHDQHLPQAIEQLFTGETVNNTEQRPALHTALRAQSHSSEQELLVKATLEKMDGFVSRIHQGSWHGFGEKPISNIVNIGIGGSDLGPRMVTQALSAFHHPMVKVHFVANVDGADLSDTLKGLSAETTLFIIASKTFTTLETIANAKQARQWLLDSGCDQGQLHKHLVAVSSNIESAKAFGINPENIFPLWDWVGGRYSLWSAIGLPIALAIGMKHFRELLSGANAMDKHFRETPLTENIPVVLAMITYWYSQYWQAQSQAVLPYAQRLAKLPAFLQQLDMESLGKSCDKQGRSLEQSGIALWGAEGTNGQHSFHQLLHQGTLLIPVDFIAVKEPMSQNAAQHQLLLSCCLSQAQALLAGKTQADAERELIDKGLDEQEAKALAPHKMIKGNRPSNMLIMESLNPHHLGALLAMYEHKVFTQGVLLGLNPFDQWGVELGKQLAAPIEQAFTTGTGNPLWDGSTQRLVDKLRQP